MLCWCFQRLSRNKFLKMWPSSDRFAKIRDILWFWLWWRHKNSEDYSQYFQNNSLLLVAEILSCSIVQHVRGRWSHWEKCEGMWENCLPSIVDFSLPHICSIVNFWPTFKMWLKFWGYFAFSIRNEPSFYPHKLINDTSACWCHNFNT